MAPISDVAAGISLDDLAGRIRRSSNFRFSWQWFSLESAIEPSSSAAHRILREAMASPTGHAFLRDTFDDMYEPEFAISPVDHHQAFREATTAFAQIMSRAAWDRLGAYSHLTDAAPSEVAEVRRVFAPIAPYHVYQLEAGHAGSCPTCEAHNGFLFTNWFYGVAWDWCFCLVSQARPLAWIACLTDTD